MDGGAVGVAVDQVADAGVFHDAHHFRRGHVHDVFRLVGVVALALHAHALGEGAAFFQGFGEHALLPLGVAGHGAELLVGVVFGAQAVAVHQQGAGAVQVGHGAFVQQHAAAVVGELVAEQKVPVAVHEEQLGPGVGKAPEGVDRLAVEGAVIVVADPGFEQIPQHIEAVGLAGVVVEQGFQRGQVFRAGRIQMQIGNKQAVSHRLRGCQHGGRFRSPPVPWARPGRAARSGAGCRWRRRRSGPRCPCLRPLRRTPYSPSRAGFCRCG